MKVINHKVQEGRHAATSITEVRDFCPPQSIKEDWFDCFNGDGFYFWDETEAFVQGPFESIEVAVQSRDKYFESL